MEPGQAGLRKFVRLSPANMRKEQRNSCSVFVLKESNQVYPPIRRVIQRPLPPVALGWHHHQLLLCVVSTATVWGESPALFRHWGGLLRAGARAVLSRL